jgi:hypothetical protein
MRFEILAGLPLLCVSVASAGVLYDASLGTLPSAQGWDYQANPNAGPVTQSVAGGVLTLNSLASRGDRAGYNSRTPLIDPSPHPGVPTLDRTTGYTLSFDVRIVQEGNNPGNDANGDGIGDRAGFSVIALSSDLEGIEIGFWEDEVWAQEDDSSAANELFTHAEGSPLDTTAAIQRYHLTVQGSTYELRRGGALLLTGPLRDYTNASGLAGLVYNTPSYIFMGDNTGSAEASVEMTLVSLTIPPPSFCPGDISGDGSTSLADFALLANNFGLQSTATLAEGDLTLDGDVSLADFSALANDFGCAG